MKQKSVSYGEKYELQTAFESKFKNVIPAEKQAEALNDYTLTYINTPKFKTVAQYIRSDYWQPNT